VLAFPVDLAGKSWTQFTFFFRFM